MDTGAAALVSRPAAPTGPASAERGGRSPRANFSQGRRGGGTRGDHGAGGDVPRGRGRGREDNRNVNNQSQRRRPPKSNTARPSAAEADRPTQPAAVHGFLNPSSQGAVATADATDTADDVEAEVCFICASPVIHNALSPCNHRTCHICALRLRALYKTKACAHCRTNAEFVVFTDDAVKRYEDFKDTEFTKVEDNLGIKYEKAEIFDDTVLLLRYNCPEPSCDIACFGWPDLHRHVKSTHHKHMCDLCTRNKKVFTHEHELFTPSELKKHEKFGDDQPGSINQSGFKGHPECGFCRERFYGDDELYTHCRDRHERCHICDRRRVGGQQQYFLDYAALEDHFKKDHFLCLDQECLDKKFVVFESEMDLKAHQLESHPNGLSKDARRDARRVDMSGFDYRSPHQENRSQRRDRGGRGGMGRGRDPNVEPLPVSSAQPLRRDELAYQRQLAIHSAQSVSTRSFGGQLTSSNESRPRPAVHPSEPVTVNVPRQASNPNSNPAPLVSQVESLSLLDASAPTTGSQPVGSSDRVRQLRHSAVIERAANLLGNSAPKMATFRTKVSNYRTGSVTAPELIDAFFVLFDTSPNELGTLIKELAEIFEVAGKRDALLKAWSDWRAINEDYPTLPGPNGLPAGGDAGSGGKRILRLKSSTAQSSRTAANQQASWGGVSGSSNHFNNAVRGAFPPLSANRVGQGRVGALAWSGSGSGTTTPQVRPTLRPSASASRLNSSRPGADTGTGNGNSSGSGSLSAAAEAFPALPAAQKPGMNVSRPGFFGSPVRRTEGTSSGGRNTPNISAWGAGGATGTGVADAGPEDGDEQGAGNKKKGKKKQVLVAWG